MDEQHDDGYKRARASAVLAAAEKPADKSADKPADKPASADKTPVEWRELCRTPAYDYSPAALLHDWAAHALHANGGKLMSRAVYEKAIVAGRAPNEHGDYTPVPEAQGDFQPDGKLRTADAGAL